MNTYKNEHVIKMGEDEILLRPTFEALAQVESNIGSIAYVAWRLAASRNDAKKSIPLTDIAKIIYFCQVEKHPEHKEKPRFSLEEIWIKMQDHGAFKLLGEVVIFISKVTAGDNTAPEMGEASKKNL